MKIESTMFSDSPNGEPETENGEPYFRTEFPFTDLMFLAVFLL
jgi:hypothetical protein